MSMNIPEKPELASRQSLRVRRFLLAASLYAVCVPLLVVAHYLGLIKFGPMVQVMIAMAAVNIALFVIFHSGLNRRFQDGASRGCRRWSRSRC